MGHSRSSIGGSVVKEQLDLNLIKSGIDEVFIVFQHDGYEYSNVVGVFSTKKSAEELVDKLTEDERGVFYNHYYKKYPVNKVVDRIFNLN
jgi:hypothetical protein